MTRPKRNVEPITLTKQDLMQILTEDDSIKTLLQTMLQEVLEAEMDAALQAAKSERTSGRLGHRSGYYPRTFVTRVGKLELRVPQDRQGRFSTELFARYQRSEKALVSALMEMYVQGVSTRRVKAITEELCGHEFSASAVSAINVKMDEELQRFMNRRLEDPYPYIIMDARYERVRENGVGQSRAAHDRRCPDHAGNRLGWAPARPRRRAGREGKHQQLEGPPSPAQGARIARGAVGGERRPRRP
jgi:putative transposase